MSKSVSDKNNRILPSRLQQSSSRPSPELVLGKILFARAQAENIVQILNNMSAYVLSNNVILDPSASTEENPVAQTLENLDTQLENLVERIQDLS